MTESRTARHWGSVVFRLFLSLLLVAGTAFPSQLAFAVEEPLTVEGEMGEPNSSGSTTQGMGSENLTPQNTTSSGTASLEGQGQEGSMGEDNLNKKELSELSTESQVPLTENVVSSDIDSIVNGMSLDEKISQLIVVACRTWGGTDMTTLPAGLAEALRKHQYGGVLLYGENIKSTAQSGNLVNQLQANNAEIATESGTHIPYFMAVDEEGGAVMRFGTGTRMNGSMAIAATGANAEANATTTGQILGEECAALGFNVDFAPSVDVNSNPANPVIGTRSFGDDPNTVATLGNAFVSGLAQKNVISSIKHFPGHGDAGTDTHIGTASVDKTIDELKACDLVPFQSAIDSNNADLIMTAHITLPNYDDQQQLPGGRTGYYPATMSKKILTDLLRNEMRYQGVIVTDALEMGAIGKAQLVEGEVTQDADGNYIQNSVYAANIAEKCLMAGADILLLPRDLKDADAVAFYNDYISEITRKAQAETDEGRALLARINESVKRVLTLKQKYGFLESYTQVDVNAAKSVVGSEAHHEEETRIAREAMTLLKNDSYTLPVSGHNSNVVIVTRDKADNVTVTEAINDLKNAGVLDDDAYINNLATGTSTGSENAKTSVTIDYYRDGTSLHMSDGVREAIKDADVVAGLSVCWNANALQTTDAQYQGLFETMSAAHAAGAKFVLVSCNLPYDSARYQEADAILASYMSSGTGIDPNALVDGQKPNYNANMRIAIETLYDHMPPTGALPVNVPNVKEEGGTIAYDTSTLYARGTSLRYAYAFTEGAGGEHEYGTTGDLSFKNNARYDKLTSVLVNDAELGANDYVAEAASTKITLKSDYLNTLNVGDYTLKTTYNYGVEGGATEVSTNFKVKATSITRATVDTIPAQGYTGKELKPSPVVKFNGTTLREGVDYTVTYANNVKGGEATVTITGIGNFVDSITTKFNITEPSLILSGKCHIQDKGDTAVQGDENGLTMGTTGESKRVEAFGISLPKDQPYAGNIEYSAHVQDIGWQSAAKNGNMVGTTHQSKRIEAVRINLTDEMAEHYNVWYRVHSQDYGWLGWAKNGDNAGTAGKALRAESIDVRVLPKEAAAPGPTVGCFMSPVSYQTHVQDFGWVAATKDGALGGTTGQSKRLEAIRISLPDRAYNGSIVYKTHVQDIGWESQTVKDGALSGTTGLSKRLEAVQIDLDGDMAAQYDVWYRTHIQDYGWLGWAKNGESAGSEGKSLRMEAIEVVLVAEGAPAPGSTANAFVK